MVQLEKQSQEAQWGLRRLVEPIFNFEIWSWLAGKTAAANKPSTEDTARIEPATFLRCAFHHADTHIWMTDVQLCFYSANVGVGIFFFFFCAMWCGPAESLAGAQECGRTRIQFLSHCVRVRVLYWCYVCEFVRPRRGSDGRSCSGIYTSVVCWQARPRVCTPAIPRCGLWGHWFSTTNVTAKPLKSDQRKEKASCQYIQTYLYRIERIINLCSQ